MATQRRTMEPSPKSKAIRRKILTDSEVRYVARAMKAAMGEPFVSAVVGAGLSITDGLRFMAVAAHLQDAREAKGLTLKATPKRWEHHSIGFRRSRKGTRSGSMHPCLLGTST